MKVLPFQIPKPNKDALIYQEDDELVFYDKLHQHSEIQISYIDKGHGSLLVGDAIHSYQSGDLFVIGSNLPHVFRSEFSNEKSLMQSLFFTYNSFGNDFFKIQEMQELGTFFNDSKLGFKVAAAEHKCSHYFAVIDKQKKLDRFISLLQLLSHLVKVERTPLSSYVSKKRFTETEGARLGKVLDFVMKNYHKDISLLTIANEANMTKTAFCKYFKNRTNKTYIQFLNEVRIEQTCKLLVNTSELSVVEIAEACGFNNMANFNRIFKRIKNTTPLHYRKQHFEFR